MQLVCTQVFKVSIVAFEFIEKKFEHEVGLRFYGLIWQRELVLTILYIKTEAKSRCCVLVGN